MDYNGDVLMCPHDWGKKIILGNMNKDNFLDIWTSKRQSKLEKNLIIQIEFFSLQCL